MSLPQIPIGFRLVVAWFPFSRTFGCFQFRVSFTPQLHPVFSFGFQSGSVTPDIIFGFDWLLGSTLGSTLSCAHFPLSCFRLPISFQLPSVKPQFIFCFGWLRSSHCVTPSVVSVSVGFFSVLGFIYPSVSTLFSALVFSLHPS